MKSQLLYILLILFFTTACSSFRQTRKVAGLHRQQLFLNKDKETGEISPTLFWAHYDASQRGGIYLVGADGKIKIISENPPDVALNNTLETLVKAKINDSISAELKLSAVKSVAELGSRNASNYMIRDLAFRIEALFNNNDSVSGYAGQSDHPRPI